MEIGGYYTWIDVCKGLALYLVIAGHLWYSANLPIINTLIYSFHMPVYFILSGYVLDTGKRGKREFIKQKFFSLLLPAYIFIILTLPLYFRGEWNGLQIIQLLLYVNGRVPYNDPCWFFITLFQVMVAARVINLSERGIREKNIIALISFIIGAILYQLSINYFGITKFFITFGYLAIGTITHDISTKYKYNTPMFITCMIGILWIIIAVANGKVSLYAVELGNYILFLIASITGSLFFVLIIQKITTKLKHEDYFIRVGQNTVFIVCTHYVLVSFIRKVGDKLMITGTWKFGIIILFSVPIIVACYLPICEWLSKHFPVLCGKLKI